MPCGSGGHATFLLLANVPVDSTLWRRNCTIASGDSVGTVLAWSYLWERFSLLMTLDVGKQEPNCRKKILGLLWDATGLRHVMQGLRLKRAVDAGNGKTYIRSSMAVRLATPHLMRNKHYLWPFPTFGNFAKPGFRIKNPGGVVNNINLIRTKPSSVDGFVLFNGLKTIFLINF